MTLISASLGNSRAAAEPSAGPRAVAAGYLKGRRGLFAFALVLAGAGLAFGAGRWGLAAVLPLLYLLPCAVMVAMCMKGHGSQPSTDEKPVSADGLLGDRPTSQTPSR